MSSSLSLLLLVLLSHLLPSLSSPIIPLPIPTADPVVSTLLWSTSTISTVGSSSSPGSPYLLLSIPISVPSSRSFLSFTNQHNLTINLTIDGSDYPSPIPPQQTVFLAIDNYTAPSSSSSSSSSDLLHSFSISHASQLLTSGFLSSLCVDCVATLTLTPLNTTSLTIERPTYALEFLDRDDPSLLHTSAYTSALYPTVDTVNGQGTRGAEGDLSFTLNFTFTLPLASFNFYPQNVLRQLSSSSVESRHPPMAHERGPRLAPTLLHVRYYYTDIILPSRDTFKSGDVLTVKGGFSTAAFDLYCCKLSNALVTFYSACERANASDTFHCVVPPAVDARGFDGEELTVVGTFDPLPAARMRGYTMQRLMPPGDDDDDSFTVDKPPHTRPWWDIHDWHMQAIIAGGGSALILTALLGSMCTWKRVKEFRQRRAMVRRAAEAAAEEEEEGEADDDLPVDVAIASSLEEAAPCGAAPPVEWSAPPAHSSALSLHEPALQLRTETPPTATGKAKKTKKRGSQQSRSREGGLQDLAEPLVVSRSVV